MWKLLSSTAREGHWPCSLVQLKAEAACHPVSSVSAGDLRADRQGDVGL